MSGVIDDDDQGSPPREVNGRSSSISAEDLQEALGKEREARIAAEKARKSAESVLEAERGHRTTAERRAVDATTARYASEENAVAGRLEATEAAIEGLQKEAAQAMAEGNFNEAAKLHRQMAKHEAKISEDERYAKWLANEKQRVEAAPAQRNELDLSNYTPAKRNWIKQHPEFMENERFRGKTTAGHHLAIAEGHEEDSPEYFAVIESLAVGKKAADPEPEQEEEPRQRSTAMAVERRAPTASPRHEVVKLTPEQRDAADTTLPEIPVDDYMEGGQMKAGRYKRYNDQIKKLRAQGRM